MMISVVRSMVTRVGCCMRLTAVTNHQIARMMINAETNNIDTVTSDMDCGEVNRGLGSSGRDIIERITPQTPGKKIYFKDSLLKRLKTYLWRSPNDFLKLFSSHHFLTQEPGLHYQYWLQGLNICRDRLQSCNWCQNLHQSYLSEQKKFGLNCTHAPTPALSHLKNFEDLSEQISQKRWSLVGQLTHPQWLK